MVVMNLKETIIESLGLVEIKKGETVRKGQTYYSIETFEGTSCVFVVEDIASKDFETSLDGIYRKSVSIDDLNLGSVVASSEELFFVVTVYGVKCFVNSSNRIYGPEEIEIDEVIYYA